MQRVSEVLEYGKAESTTYNQEKAARLFLWQTQRGFFREKTALIKQQ